MVNTNIYMLHCLLGAAAAVCDTSERARARIFDVNVGRLVDTHSVTVSKTLTLIQFASARLLLRTPTDNRGLNVRKLQQ